MQPPLSHAKTSELPLMGVGGRGVLVVGVGGLASPALRILVMSGLTRLTLVDDDVVEVSNLQRQTLFGDADVGRLKVDAAMERLSALAPRPLRCEKVIDRFVPDNAGALVEGHALVLEGADNFASKFLAADACRLGGVPLAQAGVVRFSGWAMASTVDSACLRCVFEDVPRGQPETCAAAGVLGPVVGAVAALQAALAIDLLLGRLERSSTLFSYDAAAGRLRKRSPQRRQGCPLCGGQIRDLSSERYDGSCAA